jgi:hypothetical protein
VIGVGSVDADRVATRWFTFVQNTWPRRYCYLQPERDTIDVKLVSYHKFWGDSDQTVC